MRFHEPYAREIVPPELAAQQKRPALKVVEPEKKATKSKAKRKADRPKLAALPAQADEPEAQAEAEAEHAPEVDVDTPKSDDKNGRRELPPYLRVIK